MFKKLKVELVIFEPVRFLPDSMWPCRTVCLRRVQSVGDFSVSMCSSGLCEFNAEAVEEDFSGDVSGVVGRRCTLFLLYTPSLPSIM